MRIDLKPLVLLAALSSGAALAGNGSWTFGTQDQGHPNLSYTEADKTLFMVGCGHAFVLRAVYPGAAKKPDDKAGITIANGKASMSLEGTIESGIGGGFPPDTTYFVQTDLGYDHLDSEVYGKKWRQQEARLFDFLDSGQALTVSAEGRSYGLPPIKIRNWKSRFKKIC